MDSPLNLFPDDQPVRDNRLRFLALLPPTDVARKIFAHAQRLDSDHDSSALVLRARNETNPELRNFHKRPGLALAERAGLKGVRFNLTPHITMLYASRGVPKTSASRWAGRARYLPYIRPGADVRFAVMRQTMRHLLAASALFGMLGHAHAVGFINGGFESPLIPTATFSVFTAPNAPTGWVLKSGNLSLNANAARGYGNAHSGRQYIFLPESADQAGLSQTVTDLTPGIVYKLSFWYCGFNNSASEGSCYVRVGWGSTGDPLSGLFLNVPAATTVVGTSTNPWKFFSATFTAVSAIETFEITTIRSATDLAFPAFDDVSLTYGFNGFPKIRIKAFKKSTTASSTMLRGKVASRIPVDRVTVRVGKRERLAKGTTSWRAKVRLKAGKNRIFVNATDAAGYSPPVEKRVVITRR